MELGELLALLHSAPERFDHGHIVYHDEVKLPPSRGVQLERDLGGSGLQLRWQGPGPNPPMLGMSRLIWFIRPDKMRVEFRESEELRRLLVRNGAQWSRWDAQAGIVSGEIKSVSDAEAAPPLLNPPALAPCQLLPSLFLCPGEMGTRLGRPVITVTARPRQRLPPAYLIEHQLEFDVEHGVIMRHAVLLNGEIVNLTEASHLSDDLPSADERFYFDPASAVGGGSEHLCES